MLCTCKQQPRLQGPSVLDCQHNPEGSPTIQATAQHAVPPSTAPPPHTQSKGRLPPSCMDCQTGAHHPTSPTSQQVAAAWCMNDAPCSLHPTTCPHKQGKPTGHTSNRANITTTCEWPGSHRVNHQGHQPWSSQSSGSQAPACVAAAVLAPHGKCTWPHPQCCAHAGGATHTPLSQPLPRCLNWM